jgi:tripartite-type tricarboxylate transporter receptor subunit TctC
VTRTMGASCWWTFLLLMTLPATSAGAAQTAEGFYRGKTITLEVGYAPGGGYDAYGRAFAPYFARHIPGNPAIVVQNVPGAGSLKLTNDIYNIAPRDGTVIGLVGREQITAPLFATPGVQFDAKAANWIGTLDRAVSVCVAWHTTRFRSMQDLRQHQMVVGGTGPASITVVLPKALNDVLGYKFKVISGYGGGNLVALALERGEIDGRCGWSYPSLMSTHADWAKDGKIRFLAAAAQSRIPQLPDVPTVFELTKTDRQRQVLALILAGEAMARPFLAPPDVPAERLAALRAAFMAAAHDPAFLARARSRRLEIDPADWREMKANIEKLYATPRPIVDAARNIVAGAKLQARTKKHGGKK